MNLPLAGSDNDIGNQPSGWGYIGLQKATLFVHKNLCVEMSQVQAVVNWTIPFLLFCTVSVQNLGLVVWSKTKVEKMGGRV